MASTHEDKTNKGCGGGGCRGRYFRLVQGDEELLSCGNASNILLHVQQGLLVDNGSRKRFERQSIFLDGVFDGPPFFDNVARQYSLDHHADCVRSFTLATCEQAAVMLLQGLPLEEGEWHLYVNEPDMDALLAVWLIFNHVELRLNDWEHLRGAMPLVRLEGVIDAHGPDAELLTGFSAEELARLRTRLAALRAPEQQLKSEGRWFGGDWLAHSIATLEAIDRAVLPEATLADLRDFQELARANLSQQRLAVLCSSKAGIYVVEQHLRQRYGQKLGLVVLDAGNGRMTLRQLDAFLSKDLRHVYRVLNARDPAVSQDPAHPSRWGGSTEIGGAPRRSGSALSPQEVFDLAVGVLAEPRNLVDSVAGRFRDVATLSRSSRLLRLASSWWRKRR